MTTRLASFPNARSGQVPADAQTLQLAVNSAGPTLLTASSDARAYILLRNTTGAVLRYFYDVGDYAVGFILKPQDTVRIINRKAVHLQLESGAGVVCADIGIG